MLDTDVTLINPEGLKWLAGKKYKPDAKTMLIVDESSMFKNGQSQRFKTLKRLVMHFPRRIIMTGTPAPRGFENLWSQMYLLDEGERLGKFMTQFRNRYFTPAGYMGYEYRLNLGADEAIYSKIDDIVMHKGRDQLDMPALLKN